MRPWAWAAALSATVSLSCVDESLAPVDSVLRGTLTLEVRDSASIELVVPNDGSATSVKITLDQGFGVAPAGVELSGTGRAASFPEAHSTLYTARLSAPAQPAGPCGAEPISLALSLHRQGESSLVVGGLSAYCGAEAWHGNPRRVLRLSGELTP